MGEFAPIGQGAKMTRSQVRKYIRDLEKKREIARQKLAQAKANGEFDEDLNELKELEELLT